MSAASFQERIGKPQFIALALLLLYVAQAAYLAARSPVGAQEIGYLHPQAEAQAAAPGDGTTLTAASLSPLTRVMAHALYWPGADSTTARLAARLPFIIFGALLGASMWYVARRLYANAGGYVALALYAFSPTMITYAGRVQPEIAAAWGTFGCIFTGIAVAHTLYAPREVVLWNWKRILLLGVAIGLGSGALFSVVLAIPIALGFMLYLVPERRSAALAIMAAASAIGCGLLVALHAFGNNAAGARPASALAHLIRQLGAWRPAVLLHAGSWRLVGLFLLHNGPGFVLLLAVSTATYVAWRRTRFFGNTAPLLSAVLLMAVALALPHAAGNSFLVAALPFLFVFVAGITADLLQSGQRPLALGLLGAVLLVHAYFSINGLLQL